MNPQREIVSDEWNSYVADRDGVTTFVSFDEKLAADDLPTELQQCTRIIVRILHPNEVGAPVPPENERLWQMEDELVASLQSEEVPCRLIARMTYKGLRELVFQHADRDSFRAVIEAWISSQGDYEAEVSEHQGWAYFEDCIRPRHEDTQLMRDNEQISELIQHGADPDVEHALQFAFSGSSEKLQLVAESLTERNYHRPDEPTEGALQMSIRMSLDLQLVTRESLLNRQLAREAGVKFHGWSVPDAS